MNRFTLFLISVVTLTAFNACSASSTDADDSATKENRQMKTATFAGGCFWCMEGPFEKLEGVSEAVAGYTGGAEKDPSYREVARGTTGHAEAVRISYDPAVVSYETLLETYWKSIDPTDGSGQFADRGSQYRPAIFYHDEEQREAAVASRTRLEESGRFEDPIEVDILPASTFYRAEEYHQDYYRKNPDHYQAYRRGSGRAGFLSTVWGKD